MKGRKMDKVIVREVNVNDKGIIYYEIKVHKVQLGTKIWII